MGRECKEYSMMRFQLVRHKGIFVSQLTISESSLVQAMELARHTDLRTTKRYFHNLDKLREHAVNLSPIAFGIAP
jgi:hypothetical protein